jgi:formylmethanofuran dehydrogenase subunit C
VASGFFLSAIINKSKDSTFLLNLENLQSPIFHLGFRNEKDFVILGDVSGHMGEMQKSGKITLYGNSGHSTGWDMRGGEIHVFGNAGIACGRTMNGGKIIVEGNTHNEVGSAMKGGEILIMGNAGSDVGFQMADGNIEVKGKCGAGLGHLMMGGCIRVYGAIIGIDRETLRGGDIYQAGECISKGGFLAIKTWEGFPIQAPHIYYNWWQARFLIGKAIWIDKRLPPERFLE